MTFPSKRRRFQFGLRTLLAAMTLVAIGAGWWNHQRHCGERFRFHANQHGERARQLYFHSTGIKGPLAFTVTTIRESARGESPAYGCQLEVSITESGYEKWQVMECRNDRGRVVTHTKYPAGNPLEAEMDHEAELADQYFHALWRPWERLWIDERLVTKK